MVIKSNVSVVKIVVVQIVLYKLYCTNCIEQIVLYKLYCTNCELNLFKALITLIDVLRNAKLKRATETAQREEIDYIFDQRKH